LSVGSVLRLAVQSLEQLDISYMVTGSLASAFYGEPRSTQDLDIVVHAEKADLLELGRVLREAGLYCDDIAITEAVAVRGMFNAIDPASGWKIDFIVLKDTPFYRHAFSGRRLLQFDGAPLHLIRPEDIVIAKLEWARLGGSERQIRDIVGVLMVQGSTIDRSYVEGWVSDLNLSEEWARVLEWERVDKEST
jgi:hypothetical protein